MTYYKTAKNNNIVGYWEKCKATELSRAKAEATRDCGNGYTDDVVCVGVSDYDGDNSPIRTVAKKQNGVWQDVI